MMCFTIILQVQSGRRKEGVRFYEIYYGRRQGKDEEWSHQACFSVICILLEVIFIILMFTKLNRYAEAVNLLTRVVGVIVILNMYASPVTSTIKVPWILLILMFPIMGLGLYLLVGLNGGTEKMRRRYQKIDEQLLPLLPANRKIQENYCRKFQEPEIFLPISTEMLRIRCIRIQM